MPNAISLLDAAILAENIRLGNTTPGAMGSGVLNMGAAKLKPVTNPWGRKQPAAPVSSVAPAKAQTAAGDGDGVHVKAPAPKKSSDVTPKRVIRFTVSTLPQAMIKYADEPYELLADGGSVEKSVAGKDGTFAWEHKEGTKQYEVVLTTGQRFKVDASENFDGSAGQPLANRGYRGYKQTAAQKANYVAEDDAFREVVASGKNKA